MFCFSFVTVSLFFFPCYYVEFLLILNIIRDKLQSCLSYVAPIKVCMHVAIAKIYIASKPGLHYNNKTANHFIRNYSKPLFLPSKKITPYFLLHTFYGLYGNRKARSAILEIGHADNRRRLRVGQLSEKGK